MSLAPPPFAPFEIHPAALRWHVNEGWADTCHTFHPPGPQAAASASGAAARDRFHALLGLQDELLMPGASFSRPLAGVELLTFVMAGTLGTGLEVSSNPSRRPASPSEEGPEPGCLPHARRLPSGSFQLVSAGHGLVHRRWNPSSTEAAHVLHLWLEPSRPDAPPREAWHAGQPDSDSGSALTLIAAPAGTGGILPLGLPARVWHRRLRPGQTVTHQRTSGRHAWLHVAEGHVLLQGHPLTCGDGAALPPGVSPLTLRALGPSQVLLVEVPPRR